MSRFIVFFSCLFLSACGGGLGGLLGGGGDEAPGFVIRTVTNHNNAGPGSLRGVILEAPENAVIVFDPALATGMINLTSSIKIHQTTVIGGLSGTLGRHTVSGGNTDRIFEVDLPAGEWIPHFELRDLVLTDGLASGGGAIDGRIESLALLRVQVVSCDGSLGNSSGGAIDFTGGTFLAEDCAFTSNRADHGGAIALRNTDDAKLRRCSFYLNQALQSSGGAVRMIASTAVFDNCSFLDNEALALDGEGGAVYVRSNAQTEARATFHQCTLDGNQATDGGGIVVEQNGEAANVGIYLCVLANSGGTTGSDLETLGGADVTGQSNVVRVGNVGTIFNGFDGNICGSSGGGGELDPDLGIAVQFDALGRGYRTPNAGGISVDVFNGVMYGTVNHDQRNLPRPVGGGYDAGAIERQ